MQAPGTQMMMDYTLVPVGITVVGQLGTGQATEFTANCPKCGRIGVRSQTRNGQSIVVHTGSTNGRTLEAIDYCHIEIH
jgi:hypothetical protein